MVARAIRIRSWAVGGEAASKSDLVGSGFEAVADAGFGDQIVGSCGVGLEFAPQIGQMHAEIVGFGGVARSPDLLQELLLGD